MSKVFDIGLEKLENYSLRRVVHFFCLLFYWGSLTFSGFSTSQINFFKNVSFTHRKNLMNGFNYKPKGVGNPDQNHFIPVQSRDLLDSTNQFISSRGLN